MLMSRYRPLEHQGSFHNEVKTASEYTQQSVRMGSMLCLAGANAQNFALGSHPYLSQNNEEDILTSAELRQRPVGIYVFIYLLEELYYDRIDICRLRSR